jgi:hypothetical protein
MILSYSSLEYVFISGSILSLIPIALTLVMRYVYHKT